MSGRYDLQEPGKLPLPSPRSPLELDERILSAARERAPTPEPQRQPWWIGGVATAAVLLVAVMITVPEQSPSTIEVRTEAVPTAMKEPGAAATAPIAAQADMAMETRAPSAAQPARVTPSG